MRNYPEEFIAAGYRPDVPDYTYIKFEGDLLSSIEYATDETVGISVGVNQSPALPNITMLFLSGVCPIELWQESLEKLKEALMSLTKG